MRTTHRREYVRQGRREIKGTYRVPGGKPRAQRRHARKPRLLGDRGEGERRDAQEGREERWVSGRDAHRAAATAGRCDELRETTHGLRLGLQAQQQGQYPFLYVYDGCPDISRMRSAQRSQPYAEARSIPCERSNDAYSRSMRNIARAKASASPCGTTMPLPFTSS